METIKLNAYAKINLTLDIAAIREDGYHDLDMILASVDIADTISVSKAQGVFVKMNNIVQNEKNTAFKAVKLAIDKFKIAGAKVEIKKRIPFCAGMGGSSADASGVLCALQKLYDLNEKDILEIAEAVGSDVTYMYYGGMKRAKGKGEKLQEIAFLPIKILLIRPQLGVNTGEVFKKFDFAPIFTDFSERFLDAVKCGNNFKACVGNGLLDAGASLNAQIKTALQEIKMFTPYATMTGSGSAVYGIFEDEGTLENAYLKLKDRYSIIHKLKTLDSGIRILSQK